MVTGEQVDIEQTERRRFRALPVLSGADRERFERFIDRTPGLGAGDCWFWRGAISSSGYGTFDVKAETFFAHRLALRLARQRDFPQRLACHSCDQPQCVNPAHLRAGTYTANIQDAIKRGRWKPGRRTAAQTDLDHRPPRNRAAMLASAHNSGCDAEKAGAVIM